MGRVERQASKKESSMSDVQICQQCKREFKHCENTEKRRICLDCIMGSSGSNPQALDTLMSKPAGFRLTKGFNMLSGGDE